MSRLIERGFITLLNFSGSLASIANVSYFTACETMHD